MLYLAICWDFEQDHPTPEKLWTNPSLKKLLQDWGHPDDVAVIAVAEEGVPIGGSLVSILDNLRTLLPFF